MKIYRSLFAILTLFAFVGQILHSEWNWTDSIQNLTGEFISFCANEQPDTIFLYDSKVPQTSDAKCNVTFQLLFITKQFEWELKPFKFEIVKMDFHPNSKEQVYIDQLVPPPKLS